MVDYYDAVLGLIPLSVVGISGSLVGAGIELSMAVAAGAAAGAALIGHAMFVRAPVGSGESNVRGLEGSDAGTDTYNTAD